MIRRWVTKHPKNRLVKVVNAPPPEKGTKKTLYTDFYPYTTLPAQCEFRKYPCTKVETGGIIENAMC
ncbi:hypothetical protein CAGA_11410 [Caproiciproducens galactitolivorans]|uniref:Uncharacterized protein n=1 Tax=Caproiciproducens galactitolivorans TaxID=642589 RepID=A0A4Z0YC70_9FIRM|nr:hypothetical protein CAGA_11410 [Caproiciproducens galactitolivorans]